jgi:hypothetical protein
MSVCYKCGKLEAVISLGDRCNECHTRDMEKVNNKIKVDKKLIDEVYEFLGSDGVICEDCATYAKSRHLKSSLERLLK